LRTPRQKVISALFIIDAGPLFDNINELEPSVRSECSTVQLNMTNEF